MKKKQQEIALFDLYKRRPSLDFMYIYRLLGKTNKKKMQIRIHSGLKYSHLNSFIRIQIQYIVYNR